MYHNPVLLRESLERLIINPDGIYVDCTFGGGGHSREILKRLSDKGKLFAFDQDIDALNNKIDDKRFTIINQNFRHLENNLLIKNISGADGILADLGVSSHQFDVASRGFSIRINGPLDMRMNNMQSLDAKKVINEYEEEQLSHIFHFYGELRNSRTIARKIIEAREKKIIKETEELKQIFSYIPPNKSNKFFAQIFQAIRIEVNGELEALKEMLLQAHKILKSGGILSVISYHSLEDRLVKRFFKNGTFNEEPSKDIYGNYKIYFNILSKKAIVPSVDEVQKNHRARSAKLRIAAKI